MSTTITSNHNQSIFLEPLEQLIRNINLPNNKNFLFYSLFSSIDKYFVDFVRYLENNADYDFIVLHFPFESPDFYKCINPLYQYAIKRCQAKFAVIDCGEKLDHCTHFKFNTFYNEDHHTWIPANPSQRFYKFFCANRILKPHRILLLEKLLKIKAEDNIVTAGNFNINQKFTKIINFSAPIVAPDEKILLDQSFESQRRMPESFINSIFSIVTESSYDNVGDVFETWSRIMTTEKTIKAYRLYHLPIFLAPAGHVEAQRQLGFDVFDDIIDHSYDRCLDPYHRIDMIIDLCKWINAKSINHWQKICQSLWTRLDANNSNCKKIAQVEYKTLVNNLISWTRQ